MSPILFCIVVSFNAEKWIEQCLASLIASSIPVQILVVDNASTDGTAALVKRFPDVIYLPLNQNIGFGQANNRGIATALDAGADYVFLLNQDAYVYPDTLKKLLDAAQRDADFGIISPLHLNGDASHIDPKFLEYICGNPAKAFISDLCIRDQVDPIYPTTYVNAAAWLLPCPFLCEIGGFDPLFFLNAEDDDFTHRTLYHGFKIGLVPAARICHYRERSTASGSVWRAKFRARVNWHYSILVFQLKSPDRSFAASWVRLIFFVLIQSIFFASRREFGEIVALLLAYVHSSYKLPAILTQPALEYDARRSLDWARSWSSRLIMRILRLTLRDDVGGAAETTFSLHQAMVSRGVEDILLLRQKRRNDDASLTVGQVGGRVGQLRSQLGYLLDRRPLWLYPHLKKEHYFSINWFPTGINRQVQKLAPDIVHLHWIGQGYVPVSALPHFKRPLVWTLHDFWAFTGGCYYPFGCTGYQAACGFCPHLGSTHEHDVSHWNWRQKRTHWQGLRPYRDCAKQNDGGER